MKSLGFETSTKVCCIIGDIPSCLCEKTPLRILTTDQIVVLPTSDKNQPPSTASHDRVIPNAVCMITGDAVFSFQSRVFASFFASLAGVC